MGDQTLLSWLASILHKIIEATVGRFGRGTKAQAALFYGGSSLICQSFRFVGIVISTRLTAADQFGLLATSMAMIGFSGLIKEIGQNSAYMSCRAEERGFTSFHFAWSVLGGFAAGALLLILVDAVPGSAAEIRRSIFQFAIFMIVGVVVGLVAIQLFLWFFADLTLGRSWRDSVGDLWCWGIPLAILRPYVWNFNILFTNSGKPLHLLSSFIALTISTLVVGLILVPILHARGAYLTQAIAYFVVLAGLFHWFLHWSRFKDPAPLRAS